MIHSLWCLAVSLGWKPEPGGVTYVWRTLERISTRPTDREEIDKGTEVEEDEGAEGSNGLCSTIPAPSLLALPSRPSARYGLVGYGSGSGFRTRVLEGIVAAVQDVAVQVAEIGRAHV